MKKYLAFFQKEFANTAIYRGPLFIWTINSVFQLVIMTALWKSVLSGGVIAGYTRSELVTYYCVAVLLDRFINWMPFYGTVDEIKSGEISISSLIKPFSFYWRRFAEEAGWHVFSTVFALPIFVALVFFFRSEIVFSLSVQNVFFVLAAVFLGSFVTFGISLCLGLSAFWFSDVWAFDSLFWATRVALAGMLLPLSFIPASFRTLIDFLPFRYTFSFPLEIYLGKLSVGQIVLGLVAAFFWIVISAVIYKMLWNRGRKIYASFGQ